MNRKIISVPCSVKTWLYLCTDRSCVPGRASSARISSAITPAIAKTANEFQKYRIPIFLWSVVVSQASSLVAGDGLGASAGRWTSVIAMTNLRLFHDERARHGRAVDGALEVVPAGPQWGEMEGRRRRPGHWRAQEVLDFQLVRIEDAEGVVDAGVLVDHGGRPRLAGRYRDAGGVPGGVLCHQLDRGRAGGARDVEGRRLLALDPRDVVGRRHHLEDERHLRVPQPAELGALGRIGAEPGRGEVEVVRVPWDRVAHEQQRGYVELVHHVARLQVDVDGLVDRDFHDGRLDERLAALHQALVDVVEGPLPLEGVDVDDHARIFLAVLHVAEGLLPEGEQDRDDHGRDREENRESPAAAGVLGGRPVVALAVAEHTPQQECLHPDEHGRGEDEDAHVQVVDVLSLGADALLRATGEQRGAGHERGGGAQAAKHAVSSP